MQTYTYDGANRLWTMSEASPSSLSRTFAYDAYGNRAVTGSQVGVGTPTSTGAFSASTNRMTSSWADYDAAGNQLTARVSGAQWSAAYDAENKQNYFCAGLITTCMEENADAGYVYDGEGNRVQKLTTGETTTYVYDAFGRLAAEYSTSGAGETTGRYFRTTDHLGSTRLVTNGSMGVVSRRDFFPFGEQVLANATSGRNGLTEYNAGMGFPHLFTAKERDEESGLDYFLARYYSGALGRFTSADWSDSPTTVPYASFSDPQSLNLYAYVRNRSLSYSDDDGHCGPLCTGGIGGAVGALIGGGAEAYRQYKADGRVSNWRSVGANATGGAVAGFIAGATLGTSTFVGAGYATTAAVTGTSSVVGGGVTRGINGETVLDPAAAGTDFVAGAAGGAAGKYVGTQATKALVVTPGAQQATMTTANPSSYDIVLTVVGHRSMGSVQAATNTVGTTAGSVTAVQVTNTLTPPQPPPPPREDEEEYGVQP